MGTQEKRLQKIYGALSDADRELLLAFAEFLSQRQQARLPAMPVMPQEIARPAEESVPAALKRLRQTYPMLDAADLLAEASDLLSQHLMLGRAADDVIDDMEALFQRHYHHYHDDPS